MSEKKTTHSLVNMNKGFTLAELLIVVAIIAVLVAIGIPIFSSQLEKSREATDLANVRSAYAEIAVYATSGESPASDSGITSSGAEGSRSYSKVVELKQTIADWQSKLPINIAGVEYNGSQSSEWQGTPGAGGVCTVIVTESGNPMFIWGGSILPGSCWNSSTGYLTYVSTGYDNKYRSSAVTDMKEFKTGQRIYLGLVDSSAVLKAEEEKGYIYSFGVYIVDTNYKDAKGNYKIVWDSKEFDYKSSDTNYFTVKADELGTASSSDGLKTTAQYFKKDSSGNTVQMSQAEASALASMFTVKDVN